MKEKLVVIAATMTTDASVADGVLSVDADACVVDVSGLRNVSLYLNQLVDAGNCTLDILRSIDGVNYSTFITAKDQSNFPAGAHTSIEIPIRDANGMWLHSKALKVVLSGHSSTGTYSVTAAGIALEGVR